MGVMIHVTQASRAGIAHDSSVKVCLQSADTDFHEINIGSRTKCGICYDLDSKYTCPRCNRPYCSVKCFKSSNHAGCSESFYKDCLMQEMQSQTFSLSDKVKVMKMIQDHERNCIDEEDSEEESLERRLEGVDLDDGDHLWTVLTAEEKADFQKSVEAGSLIEEWTPWWYFHDKCLVTEIDQSSTVLADVPAVMPKASLVVPKLTKLLGGKMPSPLIANNLAEVLYAYAYFTRKYNGSTKDFAAEFGYNLIFSSTFLLDGMTRPSLHEAVQLTMEKCMLKNNDKSTPREVIEIILDLHHILIGPRKENVALYAKASITVAHDHCKALKQCIGEWPGMNRTVIIKVLKKLEFLYAWVDQYTLQLPVIASQVLKIFNSKMDWVKNHEKDQDNLELSKLHVVAQNELIREIA